jgi:antitoxin component YwqK of YwqJK toxin-antitoxin module
MDGEQKYYYEDGQVRLVKHYRNGFLDGEVRAHYRNGVPMYEANFDAANLKKYEKFYYPDGETE